MNQLGIIVDVSHLCSASFWDVIEICNKPIVASHSNAKAICNHPRNLTDKQIKAIAHKNGLIGINFYPHFLNNSKNANVNDIIKHIDYIKQLVGINYIGLGTDYDGITNTPRDFDNISKIPLLQKHLLKHGYNVNQINKILQKNWLRVYHDILG